MSSTINPVNKAVQKFGNKRENLVPVLQAVVQEEKYLSEQAMIEIARAFDISSAEEISNALAISIMACSERYFSSCTTACKTGTRFSLLFPNF